MQDLSLHILDIVENAVMASAAEVRIFIHEDTAQDRLSLEISDDGRGMDEETLRKALDPFFSTRTTRRIGLGLPLLAQAAREGGGSMQVESAPGQGTKVKAVFQLSHPDRKPLGDIPGTLGMILAGKPKLDLLFEYKTDGQIVESLDSRKARES